MAEEVSREEYFSELSAIGVKSRRRKALRSEYYSLMSLIRWYPAWRPDLLPRLRDVGEILEELEADLIKEKEKFSRKKRPPPPPKFWRQQKARSYFAKVVHRKKETPVPFAEYRVWVFTTEPEKWPEKRLAGELNFLEYIASVHGGRTHIEWAKNVYYDQSFESEPVDEDEVTAPLDEIQYNMKWWHKPRRGGEIEYRHEKVMACIRRTLPKVRAPERIRQITLDKWAKRERPPRKLEARRRRR